MRFYSILVSFRIADTERGEMEPRQYNMPKKEKEDFLFNVAARGESKIESFLIFILIKRFL